MNSTAGLILFYNGPDYWGGAYLYYMFSLHPASGLYARENAQPLDSSIVAEERKQKELMIQLDYVLNYILYYVHGIKLENPMSLYIVCTPIT